MTTLCFNSIERDQWSSFGCSPEEQKVKDVRNQILHYGVDQKYLFRLEDVTKKMNTPKVVRCLEEVAKLVSIQCRQKFSYRQKIRCRQKFRCKRKSATFDAGSFYSLTDFERVKHSFSRIPVRKKTDNRRVLLVTLGKVICASCPCSGRLRLGVYSLYLS